LTGKKDSLERIRGVRPVLYHSRPGEGEIQHLFRNSFQIWQSENADLEQIVLRFFGVPRSWFANGTGMRAQQIQELADGNLELSLTLNSLEEIIPGKHFIPFPFRDSKLD
jgi:hypothetical protein